LGYALVLFSINCISPVYSIVDYEIAYKIFDCASFKFTN